MGRGAMMSLPFHRTVIKTWFSCRLLKQNTRHTDKVNTLNKPVGDWISAPSPKCAIARRVGRTCKSLCAQIAPAVITHVPCNFWRVNFGRGLNQRTTFCRGGRGELMAKKWLDSIEKQKRRINLSFSMTNRQTDKHSQRHKIIRLLG